MVKGIGVDIIDIMRIKKIIEGDGPFREKIFTPVEIEYSEGKHRREIHYAARFAAKEAFFKALGTGWRDGMHWTDISVRNDSLGKPGIVLEGKTLEKFIALGLEEVKLSLSHTREYAVAFVVVE